MTYKWILKRYSQRGFDQTVRKFIARFHWDRKFTMDDRIMMKKYRIDDVQDFKDLVYLGEKYMKHIDMYGSRTITPQELIRRIEELTRLELQRQYDSNHIFESTPINPPDTRLQAGDGVPET